MMEEAHTPSPQINVPPSLNNQVHLGSNRVWNPVSGFWNFDEGSDGKGSSTNGGVKQPSKRNAEDLYAMYENMSTSCRDLTLRDFCNQKQSQAHGVRKSATVETICEPENKLAGQTPSAEGTGLTHSDFVAPRFTVSLEGNNSKVRIPPSPLRRTPIRTTPRTPTRITTMRTPARTPTRTRMTQEKPPGVPHKYWCCMCESLVILFRSRCQVCSRVYCRQCVDKGTCRTEAGLRCKACMSRRPPRRRRRTSGYPSCFGLAPGTTMTGGAKAVPRPGEGPMDSFSKHRRTMALSKSSSTLAMQQKIPSRPDAGNPLPPLSDTPLHSPRSVPKTVPMCDTGVASIRALEHLNADDLKIVKESHIGSVGLEK